MSNPAPPDRKTYVLYHAHCADGFGAAWVAWLTLGDAPQYLPVAYGQPLPPMEEGSDVFILDFSYPLDDLRALAARMHAVIVIDHHATAKAAFDKLALTGGHLWPHVRVVFDTARSGAALTWREFMPEDPMPELVRYIEDRDLWTWQLPQSREVSAGLASYPHDFRLWTELAKNLDRLKAEGRVALRLIEQHAHRAAEGAWMQEIGGHLVPTVNATTYVDETCERLLYLHPDAPFVCAYRDQPGRRILSLRSRASFDCSEIARRFGGGGHPQACHFQETLSAGAVRIARERARHFKPPEWTAAHDDLHNDGSLAIAAACYAEVAAEFSLHRLEKLAPDYGHPDWPWHPDDWHPAGTPERNLEKAGALLAAELDRLQRLQERDNAAREQAEAAAAGEKGGAA